MQAQEIQLIQDLVRGESDRYAKRHPDKMFLFDIVSNHRCSFDLDKLDYLNRDLMHTKINTSQICYKRIISNARVIDNQIAYNKKIYNDVNIVFARRQELFR